MDQRKLVLECNHVFQSFGANKVLHDVNLKILQGEIVAIVGPSGCGKSTLLSAILGTELPAKGDVIVYKGEGHVPLRVTRPGQDRGIVYQRYSLFPFLTALENVSFGLMLANTSIPFRVFRYFKWRKIKAHYMEQAAEMLRKFKLENAMNHYPSQLSGGMCQRVAIAQALILKPRILLLDEPFGALDEATRMEMQQMLLELYAENCDAIKKGEMPPHTILIVTHQIDEGLYVGDRVVGLSQFWDWDAEYHFEPPGATVVYDNVAPVYRPHDPVDFSSFVEQRKEIQQAVFDEEFNKRRTTFLKFWDKLASGQGQGEVLGNATS